MSMSFGELAVTWLSTVASSTLKPSGFRSYESVCRRHLIPAYADMPVHMITAAGVQTYMAEKLAAGLSPRTVTNHLHLMRRLMDYGVDNGVIDLNPLVGVKPSRQEPDAARVRYLTPDQVKSLTEATPPAWRVLIAMAALTGMRKGEQLALTFADLDFDRMTISISKTIRNGIVTSPKTTWSIGKVPLAESLVPMLEDRRSRVSDPQGLVFCRRDGSALPDGLPNRILAKSLRNAGLPSVTWHEMGRHSWVVAHLNSGTDIPTLQRLGRWKTADVLLSTYAHVLPASGAEAVQRLDQLMKQERKAADR